MPYVVATTISKYINYNCYKATTKPSLISLPTTLECELASMSLQALSKDFVIVELKNLKKH